MAAEGVVELAKAQALEIEKLKHQPAGHNRHRFGSKSESADQLNLHLLLQLEDEETAAASITTKEDASDTAELKQKPKRKPLPPSLPRHEQILSPGDTRKCGGTLRAIGENVTEGLEYVPARPIECGRPGAGFLAHVLMNKCADHCPLCRQSEVMERQDIDAGWSGNPRSSSNP